MVDLGVKTNSEKIIVESTYPSTKIAGHVFCYSGPTFKYSRVAHTSKITLDMEEMAKAMKAAKSKKDAICTITINYAVE